MEGGALLVDQLVTQSAYTGSGVDDNDFAAFGSDFDTGRVAAVFQIFLAGHRNRSAGSPAFNLHMLTFQTPS